MRRSGKIAGTPVGARWPQVLPGSKAVLFTAGLPTPGPLRIDVLSFADGRARTLMEGASFARYLASGHLAWVARQTLFVAPFDLQRLELTGPAVPVVEDVAPSMYAGADFDVSNTGTLVFRRKPGSRRSTLQWLDRSGQATPLLAAPAEYFLPSVSPDGSRLAFSLGETPRVEDFQKKSKSGIATPKADVELIRQRLKQAVEINKNSYLPPARQDDCRAHQEHRHADKYKEIDQAWSPLSRIIESRSAMGMWTHSCEENLDLYWCQ